MVPNFGWAQEMDQIAPSWLREVLVRVRGRKSWEGGLPSQGLAQVVCLSLDLEDLDGAV